MNVVNVKGLWEILVSTKRNDGRPIHTRFHINDPLCKACRGTGMDLGSDGTDGTEMRDGCHYKNCPECKGTGEGKGMRMTGEQENEVVKTTKCPRCHSEEMEECLDLRNRWGTSHVPPHQERIQSWRSMNNHRGRVLVVDDDTSCREYVTGVLQMAGFFILESLYVKYGIIVLKEEN